MRPRRMVASATLGALAVVISSGCSSSHSDTPSPHQLSVIACKGQTMTGQPPAKPPATATAMTTAAETDHLSYYTFDGTTVLAPKGWDCDGASGSGGATVRVFNPKASFFAGDEFNPNEAITAYVASSNTNHPLYLACQWFRDARIELARQGLTCDTNDDPPVGEHQVRRSYYELAFTDPPEVHGTGSPSGGPNPSTGIVLFVPDWNSTTSTLAAATATCSLPRTSRTRCRTITGEFVKRFRNLANPKR